MPDVHLTQTGGSITYDYRDWLAGTDTTASGSFYRKVSNKVSLNDQADVLRNPGYVSPGRNPEDVTNVSQVTSILRNGVVRADSAYIISGGSLVLKLNTLSTGTLSTTSPFPHTIDHSHANETGDDIVNYYAKVGGTSTLQAFFSFRDDTDWDVGIYNYTADTFNDDFMSTIPATPLASPYLAGGKSAPHPLIVGDDDVLYMGDRNFVHAYDGQVGNDGTFYPAVLTLPAGWIITCFARKKDYKLMIGAYYQPSEGTASTYNIGQAKVWQWNYLDLDPDFAYDLQDNYVSELVNWNSSIAAFTSGRKSNTETGQSKLQALQGDEFQMLESWSTGGLPIRGGVEVIQNDIYWNSGGKLYAYAENPYSNEYIFCNINGTGAGTSGMLKFFTQAFTAHISYGTTTSGGLQYQQGDYNQAATLDSSVTSVDFPARKKGRLKKVDLVFKDIYASGDSRGLTVNAILDRGSSSCTIITGQESVPKYRQEIIDYQTDGTPLGDFETIQLQIVWGSGSGSSPKTRCPILENITFHFDFINI